MKNILYATDCSPTASCALCYAYRLASAMDAQLHILHIYEFNPFVTASVRSRSQLEQNFAQEQRNVLETYCQKQLEHELRSHTPNYIVKEDDSVAEAIVATANELNADLVLVGAKTSKSLRGLFAGNIASTLLNTITAPLLILPYQVYYNGLSTLLYATDFEEVDLLALERLTALAAPYGALIKVVHVPTKKEENTATRMERFEKAVRAKIHYPEMVFTIHNAANVASGLQDSIEKEIPDMLVMLEREHPNWYDRLFHKDMIRTMEHQIPIPLLVFSGKNVRAGFAETYNNASQFEVA